LRKSREHRQHDQRWVHHVEPVVRQSAVTS
jgi:hypothetical protein